MLTSLYAFGFPPVLGIALSLIGFLLLVLNTLYRVVPESEPFTIGRLHLPGIRSRTRKRLAAWAYILFFGPILSSFPMWPTSWQAISSSVDSVAERATQYSALFNMMLTFITVGLTAAYVVITRRTWREMAEARLARIRPLIDVQLNVTIKSESETKSRVDCSVELLNFGSGSAFNLEGWASLPHVTEKMRTRIRTDLKNLPRILRTGETCQCNFSVWPFPTLPTILQRSYLELVVDWDDSEGNHYSLQRKHSYSGPVWPLLSERLWFGSFPQSWSRNPGVSPAYGGMILLKEYKSLISRALEEEDMEPSPNKGGEADV